jgi:hypothetical protein
MTEGEPTMTSNYEVNFGDLSMYRPAPKNCIAERPARNTVVFCGEHISLTRISKSKALTVPYLSMIFAGKRTPSIDTAEKIAEALGMKFGDFWEGYRLEVRGK